MCKICAARANRLLFEQKSDVPVIHVQAVTQRFTDAMMFTGHDLVPPQTGALIIVPDNIGNDTTTTAVLTVGGPSIISTTNTIGDQDFYRVDLVAGQTYEFGMYAKDGGPNLVPHGDAYLEVYGPDGELIVSGDGGAPTLRNNLNSGFDVLLTFTAEESGTFFINARAFDQDGTNGTGGDFVGDYELFAREATTFAYRPYYDVDSPLYAIDWGTQVDRTSRNPDGLEGPRPTDNDFTGVGYNPYGITGKNVISYYFARQGEVFVPNDPSGDPLNTALTTQVAWGMEDWEKNAFRTAMHSYEKFADVVYVEVANRNEADFVFITYNGTPEVGVLGRMSPPNEAGEGQAEFNRNGPGWNETALVQGGFSFITLIHELGHGHGLAHPHDNGGHSGIMRGVEQESPTSVFDYTNGDFALNQSVFTMMSYEDGWESSPYGQADTGDNFGWLGGPMAFDIAVLQDKYGVNEEWATGNDVYRLKDVNALGTFYEAIWDAGGSDTIVYDGTRDANIDLRPASLQYEFGGGGWVSYAFGIHGGFTIANGVTIENATGGSGNDVLIGNGADNRLLGNAGNDDLTGGAGNDILDGASGVDRLAGGIGNDMYFAESGDTVEEIDGEGWDALYVRTGFALAASAAIELMGTTAAAGTGGFALIGNDFVQTIIANDGHNELRGLGGNDYLVGLAGADILDGGSGADVMEGGIDGDIYFIDDSGDVVLENADSGTDWVYTSVSYALGVGAHVENLGTRDAGSTAAIDLSGSHLANSIIGNAGANTLLGGGGADHLRGLAGNDLLDGGDGQDILEGGDGADTFRFESASHSTLAAPDIILGGFTAGSDRIDLELVDANANIAGNQTFLFVGISAFSSEAGRLRVEMDGSTAHVLGDVNGDGIADLHIIVYNTTQALTVGDFVL